MFPVAFTSKSQDQASVSKLGRLESVLISSDAIAGTKVPRFCERIDVQACERKRGYELEYGKSSARGGWLGSYRRVVQLAAHD